MRLATFREGKSSILYDADSLCDAHGTPQIRPASFTAEHWQQGGNIVGEAPGRGASLFLDAGGEQWVLREYRRGGMMARLHQDGYLWRGEERTRAFREMRLTATLHDRGLPVPRPVAASVTRHGLIYRARLITVRLPGAHALADKLSEADDSLLRQVGRTIRRFHDAGLDHVDLNARNLLVGDDDKVWLIDLDRCRLRPSGRWQQANLARLKRSLEKFLSPEAASRAESEILRGYSG